MMFEALFVGEEGCGMSVIASSLVRLLLLLLLLFFFFHRSGTIFPQSSSAKMRFSQVLSTAIAAGVTTAEPLANVLAANNNTLSTLNCKM
jgi:hypothetical protein